MKKKLNKKLYLNKVKNCTDLKEMVTEYFKIN